MDLKKIGIEVNSDFISLKSRLHNLRLKDLLKKPKSIRPNMVEIVIIGKFKKKKSFI